MTWSFGSKNPWIGVDMDGTLAYYGDEWLPWNVFGPPIEPMVRRIRQWRAEGKEVRIITARVFPHIHGIPHASVMSAVNTCLKTRQKFTILDMIGAVQDYTQRHVGERLPVTCAKDYMMIEQWDDRAIQVIPNTGRTISDELASVVNAETGKAQGA